ncbi:MAG: AI-2E family transporter [Gammaproteobacteria bacterium]
MIRFFTEWYRRYFSDPQAVLLAVMLVLGFTIVIFMGHMLAPVLAAIVIAYLLEASVQYLIRLRFPRIIAVTIIFLLFLTFTLIIFLGLLPLLSRQLTELVQQLPNILNDGQQLILQLPEKYPQLMTEEQVLELVQVVRLGITDFGQTVLSLSLASIPRLITVLVYLVLGPVLVFFFLKDKHVIASWFASILPEERPLLERVWQEMDGQIGNYVRGKFYEIMIVGSITFTVFSFMGLKYAVLLSALVGLSVIIPYIGATVATIPVAIAAYIQLGWGADFGWIIFAYGIIQALDGNLLVPLLFSEAVNLHPIAIIVAVLVFGGLWGFWGVFFAIPLATLVNALISAWPRDGRKFSPQTA